MGANVLGEQVWQRSNCPWGASVRGASVRGVQLSLGSKCRESNCSGSKCPWKASVRGAIVRGASVWGAPVIDSMLISTVIDIKILSCLFSDFFK